MNAKFDNSSITVGSLSDTLYLYLMIPHQVITGSITLTLKSCTLDRNY